MIVILVNGTFAENAKWLSEDSDFAKAITSNVPNSKILAYRWNGRNSFRQRYSAGIKLAQIIKDLSNQNADEKFMLIGHSHGGNVILYAMKEIRYLASKIKVVTLATPFLLFQRIDNDSRKANYILYRYKILPILLAVHINICLDVFSLLLVEFYLNHTKWLKALYVIIPVLVFMLTVQYFSKNVIGVSMKEFEARITRRFAMLSNIPEQSLDFYTVIYTRDEVRPWLGLSSNMTKSLLEVYFASNTFFMSLKRIGGVILVLVCLSMFVFAFIELIWEINSDRMIEYLSQNVLTPLLFGIMACFSIALLMFLLNIIVQGNIFFFGWIDSIHFFFIKTLCTAEPKHLNRSGRSRHENTITKAPFWTLYHSKIYSDPNSVKKIIDWANDKWTTVSL